MICIDIYALCESSHIVVSCICDKNDICIDSDTSDFIIIDSEHGEFIHIDSSIYDGIICTSECNEYIDISSDNNCVIVIDSDCYNNIFVNSESNEYIEIQSDCTNNIYVYAIYEPSIIEINTDVEDPIIIYSSYVCTISRDGYLIIENIQGDTDPPEPIFIFISNNFVNSITVHSDLNWIIE